MQNENIRTFLDELEKHVEGDLRTDEYSRVLYSTDASIYQVMPHGVLLPRHNEDIHAAIELAAKYKLSLLPRTGGSSLAGQAVNTSLVIDMTRHLDQILEINQEESWVRVQPGMVLDQLNIELRPYGLQFGPDPASSNRAALGGIVSNNSTGSHSILYGMTADHVLDMNVILSDGSKAHFGPVSPQELNQFIQKDSLEGRIYKEINHLATSHADVIRAGTPRHWRRCGGYNLDRFIEGGVNFHYPQDHRFNLAKLVCGAEGTLAFITDVKLNLVPIPKMQALAILHFESLHEALSSVPAILETDPSVVELLDNLGLTMCRQVPEYSRLLDTFVEGNPNCVLMTEFYGSSEMELISKIAGLQRHLQQQLIPTSAIVSVFNPLHQNYVWTVRKAGLGFLMSVKGDYKPIPFIEDAAVPVEHLAEYVDKIERFCNDLGTQVAYYAHASAGCVHIRPLINTKKAEEIAKLPDIIHFSVDLLKAYGGSLSSEHGDGRVRSWANEYFFGPELYKLYQDVKQSFDPENILNPGNVVNAPPVDQNLRYGASYQVIAIDSVLDFSREQGFHRAVEMCNGAGICRKQTTGTMCPSFMVTREEEHSTRGRANALRAALSGTLPEAELTSPRMYEVMDLCISCKACKSECPSSVDMAKIKIEFLAQYYKKNGTPLRARIFAHIALLSRLSSGWRAPLANWFLSNNLTRPLIFRFMGVSNQRRLPTFARKPFMNWFKQHQGISSPRKVLLFNDTFNTYNDPHIAIAATEVLEALGFEVLITDHVCCGRPMLSKGLVEDARHHAQQILDRLYPYVEKGIPIVGLEPSCYLSMRDEYRDLLPHDTRVSELARNVFGIEEFISDLIDNEEIKLNLNPQSRNLLFHGHCHQKSLVGTKPTHQMLNFIPDYAVTEVDSGCCGMAGSFGYEQEHYSISQQMAERRLVPAIQACDNETLIVAAGTSCRHQIKHFTGRDALHPVEVFRDAILESDLNGTSHDG